METPIWFTVSSPWAPAGWRHPPTDLWTLSWVLIRPMSNNPHPSLSTNGLAKNPGSILPNLWTCHWQHHCPNDFLETSTMPRRASPLAAHASKTESVSSSWGDALIQWDCRNCKHRTLGILVQEVYSSWTPLKRMGGKKTPGGCVSVHPYFSPHNEDVVH